MKWKNKGHEYDMKMADLCAASKANTKICIFGAGHRGQALLRSLRKYSNSHLSICFVDNCRSLWGIYIDGVEVISIDQYLKMTNCLTVICATGDARLEISEQLETKGYHYKQDFIFDVDLLNDRMHLFLLYEYDYLIDKYVQISLTEKCTLMCRKCAHSCPYITKGGRLSLTFEEAIKSIDCYFKLVDYVEYFDILGGEPLLCDYLVDLVDYIVEKYRERIGFCTITTNATLMPGEELLKKCKMGNIVFSISDYSESVPKIKERVQAFIKMLMDYGVSYKLVYGNGEKWVDLGLREIDLDSTYATNVFSKCNSVCREIRDDKYYYCIMARCASENLYNGDGEEDYLSLNLKDEVMNKRVFYEYTNGYNDKGYLEMCKHCRGLNAGKEYLIEPGEQI